MLIVTAARVYVDADSAPLHDAAVIIDGSRIEAVVPLSSLPGATGATRVDWAGLTVVPGFIDAHLHVTTRGAGRLHEETEEDAGRALELGAANLVSALGWGVTTVRDAGSWDGSVLELRRRTDEGILLGPRVMPAGAPLTTKGGHLHWFGGAADDEPGIRAFINRQAEMGMTHVKVMATGGWATPGSDPRLAQFTAAELRAATDEAHRHGLHTMAHISATEGVRRALEGGIDTLEHAMFQRPDGTWEYPEELLDAIVARRAWVDPTPAWHYRTVESPPPAMSEQRLAALREARGSRLEAYRRLVARGHDRWLTGTDTGGTNPRDYFPLVCQIMAAEIGLSPRQVLRAATSDAALALGLKGETGRLQPGMAADLVALESDPAEDATAFWGVRGVVARGRVLDPVPDHSALDESVGGGWE
jgi:imidazolonepropionase-like amidohydrolase